jgi:hypothetical protein
VLKHFKRYGILLLACLITVQASLANPYFLSVPTTQSSKATIHPKHVYFNPCFILDAENDAECEEDGDTDGISELHLFAEIVVRFFQAYYPPIKEIKNTGHYPFCTKYVLSPHDRLIINCQLKIAC